MTALVLSGSYQETNKFAQQKKLGYGIRHAVNSQTIKGTRPTEIHILPSYHKRRDVHALNAELRHIKRRVPRAPVVEYDYDRDTRTWSPKGEPVAAAPSSRTEVLQAMADELDTAESGSLAGVVAEAVREGDISVEDILDTVEKDTGKDAVPGQTALEEHLEDEVPDWMKS